MKIPEDLKLIYHDAKTFESSPSISNRSLVALIERIAMLTEQLHKCAVAARSYEEAVATGEPFGDEVKAVLTLRQNADAGFAELAQARAELERVRGELEQPWKHSEHWLNPETGQVECECCCSWALDTEKLVKEFDSLRAQLEQMRRPVTDEEWRQYVPQGSRARIAIDALLAARARRQEKLEKETQCN